MEEFWLDTADEAFFFFLEQFQLNNQSLIHFSRARRCQLCAPPPFFLYPQDNFNPSTGHVVMLFQDQRDFMYLEHILLLGSICRS